MVRPPPPPGFLEGIGRDSWAHVEQGLDLLAFIGETRLLFDLERGTPVKQDTLAVLATQGIAGLAYIDPTGGSRDSPLLVPTPARPLPEIKTGPSLLVRLDTAVTTAFADLNVVAGRVPALLSEFNQRAIAQTLGKVERLTGDLSARADGLGEGMDAASTILHDLAAVSAQLPALLQEVRKTVIGIERAAAGVDRVAGEGRRAVTRFSRDTSAQVGQALHELQLLGEALRRLVQHLERNPNMLLLARPPVQPGPGE